MRWRVLFILSVVANLGLLIALTRDRPTQPLATTSIAGLPPTNESRELVVVATNFVDAPLPLVEHAPRRKMNWGDLTHPDWSQYRTNLMAVGCPPATVHDVIAAELERHYLQKRGAVLAAFHPAAWNEIVRPDVEERMESWMNEMRALTSAHKATMAEVLGDKHPMAADLETLKQHQRIAAEYGIDSPDRIAEIAALEARHRESERQLHEEAQIRIREGEGRRAVFSELGEQTSELRLQHADELDAALTDEERTVARMRKNGASSWAENAHGFEPSDAEWTEVARLIDTVSGEFADRYPDEDTMPDRRERDDLRRKVREEQAAEIDRRMAELLNEERYAEFKRGKDPNYAQVFKVTERLALPQATANEAYEQISAYNAAVSELQQRELDAEQQQQVVARMKAELAGELNSRLGAEAYEVYLEHGGEWIEQE